MSPYSGIDCCNSCGWLLEQSQAVCGKNTPFFPAVKRVRRRIWSGELIALLQKANAT